MHESGENCHTAIHKSWREREKKKKKRQNKRSKFKFNDVLIAIWQIWIFQKVRPRKHSTDEHFFYLKADCFDSVANTEYLFRYQADNLMKLTGMCARIVFDVVIFIECQTYQFMFASNNMSKYRNTMKHKERADSNLDVNIHTTIKLIIISISCGARPFHKLSNSLSPREECIRCGSSTHSNYYV